MENVINNYGTLLINEQPKAKTWKRSLKIGSLFITFSNCRVKKRIKDREWLCTGGYDIKLELYSVQNGKCPICGQTVEFRHMEMHHVLPWSRFPELRYNRANIMLLCSSCHKEIHADPFKNIRMMSDKAKELGVKLEDKYAVC